MAAQSFLAQSQVDGSYCVEVWLEDDCIGATVRHSVTVRVDFDDFLRLDPLSVFVPVQARYDLSVAVCLEWSPRRHGW